MRAFKALFADWGCYLATVPTYAGGPMAMGWGTDGGARGVAEGVLAERLAAAGLRARLLHPEVHRGGLRAAGLGGIE
jgi:spermidine synthase